MLGIIGAMEEEVVKIKAEMQNAEVAEIAGMRFYKGKIGGKETVVVQSGIGKVNAAICSQILIDRFGVSALVNTGIAGSLMNEINIGDVVLSTDAVHHDMDATIFGYKPGHVPQLEALAFPADERLIKLAGECCKRVNPGIGVFTGRVLTGDQFIADNDKKAWMIETFNGACVEMEGAAIAQTAYRNGIPFLIIREISDKADGSAQMDYSEFEKNAIECSVRLVLELVSKYE